MVKPGEKRPASRQKSIVDLFQKPAKTTRGISDRSKTPSSVVGQNNELSPSLPGENIELSPPLPGENNELSPSSVVAEHRGPSCPLVVGENPTFSSSKPQSDTKLPKASTLSNWRQTYEWLEITERNTMICKICVSQKEQIILKNPSSPMGFIHGASNFKSSALKEHSTSECHRTGVEDAKHQEAIAAGISLPPKHVVQSVPEDSAIASGLQKMGEKERSGLKKLMDVAYFIALKGRPFTDFKDLIELEKLHDVKFDTSAYENESACLDFIKSTASYLFDIDVRKKLTRVNFIAILVDGTTDRAVTEQEVLYVMYVDPDTHKPTLSYFEVIGDG